MDVPSEHESKRLLIQKLWYFIPTLITGDFPKMDRTAVGKELGIDEVHCQCHPADKSLLWMKPTKI